MVMSLTTSWLRSRQSDRRPDIWNLPSAVGCPASLIIAPRHAPGARCPTPGVGPATVLSAAVLAELGPGLAELAPGLAELAPGLAELAPAIPDSGGGLPQALVAG